jgi:integrase
MPGSKFYWYRWQRDSKRHAVSLKTDDLSEAIKKVREIQAGEFFVRLEQPSPKTQATKVVDKYLAMAESRGKKPMRVRTANTIRYILLKFIKDTGIQSVQEINQGVVEGWLGRLKKEGSSPDTLNKYGMTLKVFAGHLVDSKLLRPDLLEGFDVPERGATGRKNWLKAKEVARVIGECKDPELTFVLYCGFHAGLRRNEIANAKCGWFDLDAGLLHLQNDPETGFTLKDRDNRTVPLTKEFLNFLRGFLANRNPGDYAIAPDKQQGRAAYRYDFNKSFRTHMRTCGVRCTIHDMRRSFASQRVSAGQSVYIVARWLGDGVEVVERSYGHLSPSAGDVDRVV